MVYVGAVAYHDRAYNCIWYFVWKYRQDLSCIYPDRTTPVQFLFTVHQGRFEIYTSELGNDQKVYVPKYLYPLSSVLFNYVIFLISLIVLAMVSVILGVKPTFYLLQAPIALILILIMSYGCGMILATIGVFFRDMEYLWSVALMLVMYTCAIFYYPEKLLKSGWAWILKYNPLYCVIDIFRCSVFGKAMNIHYFAYALIFSVVAMVIGLFCFKKKQDDFILYI